MEKTQFIPPEILAIRLSPHARPTSSLTVRQDNRREPVEERCLHVHLQGGNVLPFGKVIHLPASTNAMSASGTSWSYTAFPADISRFVLWCRQTLPLLRTPRSISEPYLTLSPMLPPPEEGTCCTFSTEDLFYPVRPQDPTIGSTLWLSHPRHSLSRRFGSRAGR